jgi:uncharacterized protein DUF6941
MAALDYAILAEFARVDSANLLTVVGGSFDKVQTNAPSATQQIYVALRVLLSEDEDSVAVEVRAVAPSGEPTVAMSNEARRSPEAQPLDGMFNIMLAIGMLAILQSGGRYVVQVLLNGDMAKELPFLVDLGEPIDE